MLQIAIVEDEKSYRDLLESYLNQYAKEHFLEIHTVFFEDGDEIIESYKCEYDIILMDIMMQFMDGMTAAETIRKQDEEVIIIFITNMINYAIKGYKVAAFDYILKPITYYALEKSLDRALVKVTDRETRKYININVQGGIQKLELTEICYIESQAHYLTFYTQKGQFKTYMRIKDIEAELPGEMYYRINKGLIVNLRYVEGMNESDCIIENEKLPISRAKKKEFMEKLNAYINSH